MSKADNHYLIAFAMIAPLIWAVSIVIANNTEYKLSERAKAFLIYAIPVGVGGSGLTYIVAKRADEEYGE
jgi:hypothetical protein